MSLHNPVLNGSTKKTILGVTIMVGLITMTALISLVSVIFEDLTLFHAWRAESILGSVVLLGLGIFSAMIKKFMDTRTSQQKDEYKLNHYDIKMNYKNNKLKIKYGKIK